MSWTAGPGGFSAAAPRPLRHPAAVPVSPAADNLLVVVVEPGRAEVGDPRDELFVGTGAALPAYGPEAFQPPEPGTDRMFLEY